MKIKDNTEELKYMRILFEIYDTDKDFKWDYQEFLNFLLTKTNIKLRSITTQKDVKLLNGNADLNQIDFALKNYIKKVIKLIEQRDDIIKQIVVVGQDPEGR